MARAAKHSKAVVEEPLTVPSVAAPAVAVPVVPVAPVVDAPVVSAPVATPVAPVVKPVAKVVAQEEIAKLAYCYWADRGYQGGSPDEDWARAEKTLTATA